MPATVSAAHTTDLAYAGGITALDVDYVRPALASSHLIVERGRAAFVDSGTTLAAPRLLAALAERGIERSNVDYLFLTHIHLDHAGGAGELARHLPNARIVVHPRGVEHLADPARLIKATRAVYGDATFERLYGDIVPIARERLLATSEDLRLDLAGRGFGFLHTPGHALHHIAIVDHGANAVFTGDTFGISYREFDVDGRPFVFPTTTPSQFDPDQLKDSIARIAALEPAAVFLTHYGRITPVAEEAVTLARHVDRLVEITMRSADEPSASRERTIAERLYVYFDAELDAHGYRGSAADRRRLLRPDVELNAQGLVVWLERLARAG